MQIKIRLYSRLMLASIGLALVSSAYVFAQKVEQKATVTVTESNNQVLVHTVHDDIHIAECSPSVLHITARPRDSKLSDSPTPWILQSCGAIHLPLLQAKNVATISTSKLLIKVALDTGTLSFFSSQGYPLLSELGDNPHSYRLNGENLYRVGDRFNVPEDEAFYGLGQHQSGLFNYRDSAVILSQINTDVGIPFLVSTRGYGLLWNSAARTTFDNRFQRTLKVTVADATSLDFYFIYGPEMDQVIHNYRDLTGHAPLFGEWTYGFFQSKDRYKSQDELLQVVEKYRSLHIPLDTIVQDWHWWKRWGGNQFNSSYPDFPAAVRKIHADHAHIMISIWPKFDSETPIYQQMSRQGLLIAGTSNYDATNPKARGLYWKMLPGTLLAKGVDAFWLDDSEPEDPNGDAGILPDDHLYLGNGALYTNIYPFMHTYGVYRHWRQATSQKRVFLLTRSAFTGQQHNGAATWSGDVYSNFGALKRQIPAGLNFALSGVPYWTTDIGGYGYPNGDTSDPKYQEVFTRWFEFGAFCPIFRTHGRRANDQNEIWAYGMDAPVLIKFDKLRYRLLPYIYSLAWQVTNNDYTIMRPLVMDWRTDRKVWQIGDQFMFGPALLVNPVTKSGAVSRSVYLPPSPAWYDFWTGKQLAGDQTLNAPAPIGRIPLYVRAGSILPLGPEIEYAREKPDGPIELRIYRGANGSFVLYQDQGDTYAYEHGAYATIPIHWDESSHTLRIGARSGQFPGMPKDITFDIVWVGDGHGAGPEVTANADKQVVYSGETVEVKAPSSAGKQKKS